MDLETLIREELHKMMEKGPKPSASTNYKQGPSTKKGTKRVYSVDDDGSIHLTTLKYATDNRLRPIDPGSVKQDKGNDKGRKQQDMRGGKIRGEHQPVQIFLAKEGEPVKPEINDILYVLDKNEKGIIVGILKGKSNDIAPDQTPQ